MRPSILVQLLGFHLIFDFRSVFPNKYEVLVYHSHEFLYVHLIHHESFDIPYLDAGYESFGFSVDSLSFPKFIITFRIFYPLSGHPDQNNTGDSGRAGSTPAFATSVQMMDTSVPIRVHNLAYKAVKNMRVKNVTVLMDTHKTNAGAKRNNIM